MELGLGSRARLSIAVLEWRASRIKDPVERLRYLRRSTRSWGVQTKRHPLWSHGWKSALLIAGLFAPAPTASDSAVLVSRPSAPLQSSEAAPAPNVWLVDDRQEYQIYSNGLRIENQYLAKPQRPPGYAFQRVHAESHAVEFMAAPAGIVYHTTESHIVPFEQDQNGVLKRAGEGLLQYVRRNRSYHFVIDRFGRVFRIVPEDEPANHAGRSIWSGGGWLYINLNHSFLGIAFEAQTRPEGQESTAGAAQIHAARILTAMLRSKYRMPASHCVTHAQVSVNPDNWRIGYHTDWAANFPFIEIGLPDNYTLPPAALFQFGFGYDPDFIQSTGARMWKGLALAEDHVRQQAAAAGLSVFQYRKQLQKNYRELIASSPGGVSGEENN